MTPEEAAALLGVRVDASRAEIEFAYRRAARASHPDLVGESDAFVRVTEAHDVLIDLPLAGVAAGNAARREPKLSIPLLITWTVLLLFAIAVSVIGSTFPLTPLEPLLRYGLLAVASVAYAITGKRIFLILTAIAIIATAVEVILFTTFGSLVGMLLLVAPLYGLLVTRARLRRM